MSYMVSCTTDGYEIKFFDGYIRRSKETDLDDDGLAYIKSLGIIR